MPTLSSLLKSNIVTLNSQLQNSSIPSLLSVYSPFTLLEKKTLRVKKEKQKEYHANTSYASSLNYRVSCHVLYLLREFTTNAAGCECLIGSFARKEKVSINIKFFFKICDTNVPPHRTGVGGGGETTLKSATGTKLVGVFSVLRVLTKENLNATHVLRCVASTKMERDLPLSTRH